MLASAVVENLREDIERFVAQSARPALLDPGEEPLSLRPGQWTLSQWSGKLVIQAWDAERNLVRRIVALKETRKHRISLVTERFPKTRGEMQIADLAAPESADLERRSSRAAFRDRFHLMLAREWPAWRIEEVSAEANLEESLSQSCTRAFLRRGSAGIAAMALPPESLDGGVIVPAALIWLEYLRRRERNCSIGTVVLFVPPEHRTRAAFRVAMINPSRAGVLLMAYDERDRCGPVDLSDAGNLESALPPARQPAAPNLQPPEFPAMEGLETVQQSDGSISLRIRGLEFARWVRGKLSCGIGRRRRCDMDSIAALAREVLRVRNGACTDTQHPFFSQQPEGWLESQVRANPQAIDPSLMPAPLYGQVPVFAAPDRGIVDLLGIDHTGRLVVVELKTTADYQLPFQALDYWIRVRKHLLAGDFERQGYFPGHTIRREEPRIVLAAPSLAFHSTSETVIGCLAPSVEITRVGLAADWRSELRTMFRLRGAERP